MKTLTRADEILLVAVLCRGDDAYSTSIREEIEQRTGKSVTAGSLWVSLDHLCGRGLLRKLPTRSASPLGGRPRVHYRLTPRAVRALERVRELQNRLWTDVPEPSAYQTRRRRA